MLMLFYDADGAVFINTSMKHLGEKRMHTWYAWDILFLERFLKKMGQGQYFNIRSPVKMYDHVFG